MINNRFLRCVYVLCSFALLEFAGPFHTTEQPKTQMTA